MSQVVIGIIDEIAEGRRTNQYFVPIAKPKKGEQLSTQNGPIEENKTVNDMAALVLLTTESFTDG